jgi:hypothetical protein
VLGIAFTNASKSANTFEESTAPLADELIAAEPVIAL